jgi:hypothetical protein
MTRFDRLGGAIADADKRDPINNAAGAHFASDSRAARNEGEVDPRSARGIPVAKLRTNNASVKIC